MRDVTEKLLNDQGTSHASNTVGTRLRKSLPAKALDKRLLDVVEQLRMPRADVTMGFVSGPLVYSTFIRGKSAAIQSAIFRMLKGGFLIVVEHMGTPPEGTYAYRDARYGDRYYELAMNPAKFPQA